jgi:hypothetical protein
VNAVASSNWHWRRRLGDCLAQCPFWHDEKGIHQQSKKKGAAFIQVVANMDIKKNRGHFFYQQMFVRQVLITSLYTESKKNNSQEISQNELAGVIPRISTPRCIFPIIINKT